MLERIRVVNHPYAQAVLTKLRDRRTGQIDFRKGLVRLGRVLGLELVKEFEIKEITVETPLGPAKGVAIPGMDNVVIITILRAAMPLTEGLIKVFPAARQGVVSARRVEEKGMGPGYEFEIEITYVKIPEIKHEDTVIIADPMLATGSTMVSIMDEVLKRGRAKRYFIASVISTPVGIAKVLKKFRDVDLKIYTVAIDEVINEMGYIVPGLGDAGDRAFGG
ncbi:MAG: uracil phosphoribosyltransferase [Thermoprotei archaeon]|nr:MAG: uracil phosphoribosyltransferase [Thermoprotei archaeon]